MNQQNQTIKRSGFVYSKGTKKGFLRMQHLGIPKPPFRIEDKLTRRLSKIYKAYITKLILDFIQKAKESNANFENGKIVSDGAPEGNDNASKNHISKEKDSTEIAKELKSEMWGTNEEIVKMATPKRNAHSFDEARIILEEISEQSLKNPLESKAGISAELSRKKIKKILSGKAWKKSSDLQRHLQASANLDELYKNAIEPYPMYADKNEDPNLKGIHRLYSPMLCNENGKKQIIPIKFTVKEYTSENEKNKMYSIEAIDFDLGVEVKDVGNFSTVFKTTTVDSFKCELPMRNDDSTLERIRVTSLDERICNVFDSVNKWLNRSISDGADKIEKALKNAEKSNTNTSHSLIENKVAVQNALFQLENAWKPDFFLEFMQTAKIEDLIDKSLTAGIDDFSKKILEDSSDKMSEILTSFSIDKKEVFAQNMANLKKLYIDDSLKRIQGESDFLKKTFLEKLTDYIQGNSDTFDIVAVVKSLSQSSAKGARFFARDQMQKFNKAQTLATFSSAGVKTIKWCTCRDVRVRQSHKDLDGKIFPITDLPKEINDYNCRCGLVPVEYYDDDFVGDSAFVSDSDFDESEHKRDEKGRFAEKESSKEISNDL